MDFVPFPSTYGVQKSKLSYERDCATHTKRYLTIQLTSKLMRYLYPQWSMGGQTRMQTRHPEYAAQGRAAVMWKYEFDGPRIPDAFLVWSLSQDGFIRESRELDGKSTCREFYVRLCDLERIGENNLLYVLPRK
ncbi:MAG: hypothetical protein J4428_00015 [Candidatus Aenigmarchaeota archaeon]|nr:hypothetical protein [Candidatus Aenigmarchaeota archaeon]